MGKSLPGGAVPRRNLCREARSHREISTGRRGPTGKALPGGAVPRGYARSHGEIPTGMVAGLATLASLERNHLLYVPIRSTIRSYTFRTACGSKLGGRGIVALGHDLLGGVGLARLPRRSVTFFCQSPDDCSPLISFSTFFLTIVIRSYTFCATLP